MYENGHDFCKGHLMVYTGVVLAASDFDISENPWAPSVRLDWNPGRLLQHGLLVNYQTERGN